MIAMFAKPLGLGLHEQVRVAAGACELHERGGQDCSRGAGGRGLLPCVFALACDGDGPHPAIARHPLTLHQPSTFEVVNQVRHRLAFDAEVLADSDLRERPELLNGRQYAEVQIAKFPRRQCVLELMS
jgi:hypothetical protein